MQDKITEKERTVTLYTDNDPINDRYDGIVDKIIYNIDYEKFDYKKTIASYAPDCENL